MPTISSNQWFIKQKKLGIVSSSISTTSGGVVRYSGPSYATPFIEGNLEQESELPSQFHSTLVYHVLMKRFAEIGDTEKAALYRALWSEGVQEARIMADDDKQVGGLQVMAHDF